MGGSGHDQDADCHFAASGIAAIVNFPLWRASAIAQSGKHCCIYNSISYCIIQFHIIN